MAERPALRAVGNEPVKSPALALVSDVKSWIRTTTVVLGCLLGIGFFGRVIVGALIVQRQANLDQVTQTISELDAANRSLLVEITQLESTERIYKIALAKTTDEVEGMQGLGMHRAERTIYLNPISDNNLITFDDKPVSQEGSE